MSENESTINSEMLIPDDENRLRQDTHHNVRWQWDNNPTSCREALSYVETDRTRALNKLKRGQSQNPAAQRFYDISHGRLIDFWDIVATTTHVSPNFDEATIGINWQYSNNLASLDAADREWRINQKNIEHCLNY